MNDPALNTIFPKWYTCPLNPTSIIECLIINWLFQEVPAQTDLAQALLMIRGWRRQDVIEYMQNIDWTARMYDGKTICLSEREYWDKYNRGV